MVSYWVLFSCLFLGPVVLATMAAQPKVATDGVEKDGVATDDVAAGDLADVSDARGIRNLDGFGNNVENPLWGNADQTFFDGITMK